MDAALLTSPAFWDDDTPRAAGDFAGDVSANKVPVVNAGTEQAELSRHGTS